jgi:hypothetical protein
MISEQTQYEELKDLVLGKMLGVGVYRNVRVFKPKPDLVIKCAIEDPSNNYIEWEIWNNIKDCKELSKWFAPCVSISDCGLFLLQKRVETKPKKDYPKKIPAFFSDTKYSNFGWLNGKFVCCDYSGFNRIYMDGKPNTKLVKADWWGE